MFTRGKDGNLQTCVLETDNLSVLIHVHSKVAGGKVKPPLRLYFGQVCGGLSLFYDANEFVKHRNQCQHTKPPIYSHNMPLRLVMAIRDFQNGA